MAKADATSYKIQQLHGRVKQMLANGQAEDTIIKQLGSEGLSADYVQTILANLDNEKSDKKSFRNSLIMGLFYIATGLIINFISYRAAAANGSMFFYLFWGVLVMGVVTIIRGFMLYRK